MIANANSGVKSAAVGETCFNFEIEKNKQKFKERHYVHLVLKKKKHSRSLSRKAHFHELRVSVQIVPIQL